MSKIKYFVCLLLWLSFSQAATAMELSSFSGKATTLSQQLAAGKWTVVVFWSHDCAICRHETPMLSQFHHAHREIDARVVGVSIDGAKNKAKAEQFMQQTAMGFPSYLSELVLMAASFYQITGEEFRGTPTFLLYSPSGELMGMQTGPVRRKALEEFIQNNKS